MILLKTINHKCPSCNANLKYNPKNKNWKCEYCGSVFTLKDLKKNEEKYDKTEVDKKKNKSEEMDEYFCQDCGAKIVASKNTSATFCVYCKNTAILKSRLTDKFSPSKIIPFSKTKEDAIEAFKKVGKGKILMPKEFTLPKNIEELTGIYIPFWLYTGKIKGKITGKGNKVRTWSTRDYIYTETKVYSIERNGEFKFNNIPVDGSVRFNDAIMNSIEPFDYKELFDFNASYWSGFLGEIYDVEANEAKKISIDRARETCYNDLCSTIAFSSFVPEEKNSEVLEEKIDYVLLPVWMVNIKYNEKLYTFAMNGQTGKMIGDIPYDKKKAFLLWIIIFIISFTLLAIITYFI